MPTDPTQPRDPIRHLMGDRATAPAALELDSPTAWAEFERLSKQPTQPDDPAYAATEPAPIAPAVREAPAPALTPLRAALTLQEVLVEARRYNRICPKPAAWQHLHDLLAGAGPLRRPVPQPLSGRAWQETGAMQKRMCLRDQIEWAEEHGRLPLVMDFFEGLGEGDWQHVEG